MDPTVALADAITIARGVLDPDVDRKDLIADAEDLAEFVLNLDGWVQSGGFLPLPWAVARRKDR